MMRDQGAVAPTLSSGETLKTDLLFMHFEHMLETAKPYQLEKIFNPHIADSRDFNRRRPRVIDKYRRYQEFPTTKRLKKFEEKCEGVTFVATHPFFDFAGGVENLSLAYFQEAKKRLNDESPEFCGAVTSHSSSEYVRLRRALHQITIAALQLCEQRVSGSAYECESAEWFLIDIWEQMAPYLGSHRNAVYELLEVGPLKFDFRGLNPFQEEKRFKEQFGRFFNFNRLRRRALLTFQREADVTTSDIKLYWFTGSLKFAGEQFSIDKANIDFAFRFGVCLAAYFFLLIMIVLLFATPISADNLAECVSRLVSALMLGLLASLGYLAYIKPKVRLNVGSPEHRRFCRFLRRKRALFQQAEEHD